VIDDRMIIIIVTKTAWSKIITETETAWKKDISGCFKILSGHLPGGD
jgi:hypothetical protein